MCQLYVHNMHNQHSNSVSLDFHTPTESKIPFSWQKFNWSLVILVIFIYGQTFALHTLSSKIISEVKEFCSNCMIIRATHCVDYLSLSCTYGMTIATKGVFSVLWTRPDFAGCVYQFYRVLLQQYFCYEMNGMRWNLTMQLHTWDTTNSFLTDVEMCMRLYCRTLLYHLYIISALLYLVVSAKERPGKTWKISNLRLVSYESLNYPLFSTFYLSLLWCWHQKLFMFKGCQK